MNEYDSPQTVRLVTRSRPPSEVMDEAAAEIERLRLTDAEREAIDLSIPAMQYAADELGLSSAEFDRHAATLRGLLERTQTVEK